MCEPLPQVAAWQHVSVADIDCFNILTSSSSGKVALIGWLVGQLSAARCRQVMSRQMDQAVYFDLHHRTRGGCPQLRHIHSII